MSQLSPAQRRAFICQLRALPDDLAALVGGLTPVQLTCPYLRGEWTVAQNVHHLYDSHARGYLNCKLILTEAEPSLTRDQQDAFAELADGSSAAIGDSLALLRGLHNRWCILGDSLPDATFGLGGWLPGPIELISLDSLLALYAGHGPQHLDQIRHTLAAGKGLRRPHQLLPPFREAQATARLPSSRKPPRFPLQYTVMLHFIACRTRPAILS